MSTLDRDAAREVLIQDDVWIGNPPRLNDALLDALEACIRPAPAQTIDRDALREIVADYGADEEAPLGATLDAILALLRPVEQ